MAPRRLRPRELDVLPLCLLPPCLRAPKPWRPCSAVRRSGNTALHMCVIHRQCEMYDFLVDFCDASDSVPNNQGLTPLVRARPLQRWAACAWRRMSRNLGGQQGCAQCS
jgi:hypothetical protein